MPILELQPDGSAGKDTSILGFFPSNNFGISTTFQVGTTGFQPIKSLLQFDLSSLPSNAIISSAVLTLVCTNVGNATSMAVQVRRALTDWFEGNSVSGTTTINGSTWNLRNHIGSVQWGSNTPGGLEGTDYSATAAATVNVTSAGTYNFDLTSEVVAMASGLVTNRGWWIFGSLVDNNFKTFASSDNATPANRPKLTITYTVPSVTLQPSSGIGLDTFITTGNLPANWGTNSALQMGRLNIISAISRTLIKFDLSSLPPNIVITGARVGLYINSAESTVVDLAIHRSLVEWFETGSSWNFRNNSGSVAWAGGAGGAAGSDWNTTPTDTITLPGSLTGLFVYWNVTNDVINFVKGVNTNHGWWIKAVTESGNNQRVAVSSDSASSSLRPVLQISYLPQNIVASLSGQGSLQANITGRVLIEADLSGSSIAEGAIRKNPDSYSDISGIATVQGAMRANGYMHAAILGSGSIFADITSIGNILPVNLSGSGSVFAHLEGRFDLAASLSGQGNLKAEGELFGLMRSNILGSGTVFAKGWGYAKNVVKAELCDFEPLFYITDGTFLNGGQKNLLDLINPKNGFLVDDWNPNIAQYKEGGVFSDSPFAPGRRLVRRVFANGIEIIDLKLTGHNQNNAIRFIREMFAWQELAADYWTGDFSYLPVYLVARAARETETRYAIIHTMSVPELANPYAQPFFTREGKATIEKVTLRIERGDWTDTPPGQFECVAASSSRSWTVASWQDGGA